MSRLNVAFQQNTINKTAINEKKCFQDEADVRQNGKTLNNGMALTNMYISE